jgi:hypothetical protein
VRFDAWNDVGLDRNYQLICRSAVIPYRRAVLEGRPMKRTVLAFVFLAFISGISGYVGGSLAADALIPLMTQNSLVDWWFVQFVLASSASASRIGNGCAGAYYDCVRSGEAYELVEDRP